MYFCINDYNCHIEIVFIIIGIVLIATVAVLFRKHSKEIFSFVAVLFVAFFGWGLAKEVLFTPEQKVSINAQEQGAVQSFRRITNYFQTGSDSLIALRQRITDLIDSSGDIQSKPFIDSIVQVMKTQSSKMLDSVQLPTQSEYDSLNEEDQLAVKNQVIEAFSQLPDETAVARIPLDDKPPVNAQVVKQGLFTDQMSVGKAQGLCTIYTSMLNTYTVYIQELEVTYGPELGLYLASVEPINQTVDSTFFYIGPLKGISGNQSYTLPKDVNINQYDTIFIYSPVVDTVYAAAPLR